MEENKTLVLKLKEICGKTYYYPENEASKIVLSMVKTSSGKRKALTVTDIESLKKLGFNFKILTPKVTYEEHKA